MHTRAWQVVVVGGGPGGLAAVSRLRERGGRGVDVTLIAPGARATFLAGTLDVLLDAAPPESFVTQVGIDDVRCLDGAVASVSAGGVIVAGERLSADAVIAAPGLEVAMLPPWPRASGAWDPVRAESARSALPDLSVGRLVVAACSPPYRCPPAPFALAIGLADRHMRARHMTRVIAVTPEPMPLAGVGGEAPALVLDACAAAGVRLERGFDVDLAKSVDGVLRAADGRELSYDAAFLVPPHVRARCLEGLPGEGPLVEVEPDGSVDGSLLYVVGDAAATGLPRAAGIAAGNGLRAADAVLERLGVAPAPEPPPLVASCFMLHYGGAVSRLRVSFRGVDEPRVEIDGPSLDLRHAREGDRRRFAGLAAG